MKKRSFGLQLRFVYFIYFFFTNLEGNGNYVRNN